MNKIVSKVISYVSISTSVLLLATMIVKTYKYINKDLEGDGRFFTGMITDGGGVNDQSFQESAWSGMKLFSQRTGAKVQYIECPQA